MKPSSLPVTTGSMKRARSQDDRSTAEPPVFSPLRSSFPSSEMKPPLPKFLSLPKGQISARFHDLEWKQRFRLAHALQNPDSPWKIDRSTVVVQRNRYMNIQPWANSRITLRVPEGQSDYVNASPIILKDSRGDGAENKYIATQGPKDTSHFWHMVLQESQEPAVVIMLTQTHEGNREKCAQYYPPSMDAPTISLPNLEDESSEDDEPHDPFYVTTQPLESGSLTLLELINDPTSRSEIRKLQLVIGEQTRTIYHYLFKGWPDFGKPEGEDRLALVELTKQTSKQAGNLFTNPRIVHCSAGVGRTGTFIALDYLLKELENGALDPAKPDSINSTTTNGNSSTTSVDSSKDETASEDFVYQTVNLLREQRMMMVMNEVQYSFIYEVLRQRWEAKYHGTGDQQPPHSHISSQQAVQTPPTPTDSSSAEDSTYHDNADGGSVVGGGFTQGLEPGERSPKIARKNSQFSTTGTGDANAEIELPSGQDIYAGTKVEQQIRNEEDTVSE